MDTTKKLNTISFLAGYGGVERGLELAGERINHIAICEIEAYAIANLISKMESGALDSGPIWTDAKTFPGEQFLGKVDLFTGGFPCQPFSSAGSRNADSDPRHLWPACIRAIESFRPHRVFFENVEGLISAKLGGTEWSDPQGTPVLLHVLRQLERRGYKATWGVFSASEAGAPHQRKRVFILGELADSNGINARRDARELYETQEKEGISERNKNPSPIGSCQDGGAEELADSKTMFSNGRGNQSEELTRSEEVSEFRDSGRQGRIQELADSNAGHAQKGRQYRVSSERVPEGESNGFDQCSAVGGVQELANSHDKGLERALSAREAYLIQWSEPNGTTARCSGLWPSRPGQPQYEWEPPRVVEKDSFKCELGRNSNGTARKLDSHRVDRLRLLGNGVVPQTAAIAWKTLTEKLRKNNV